MGSHSLSRRPQEFPARIAPNDPNYHYYHLQSEPLAIPAKKLLQAIVANPTPSFLYGRPATPQGHSERSHA